MEKEARSLMKDFALNYLLITKGDKGMSFYSSSSLNSIDIPPYAKEVYDVSGAGDTVISVLAACCSAKYNIQGCLELANLAASIVVSKSGTQPILIDELRNTLHKKNRPNKIYDDIDLLRQVIQWRKEKHIINFTNGCFDIFHPGHLNFLKRVSEVHGKLIVAINSDSSIKVIKSNNRPVFDQNFRSELIASLDFIDAVIIFNDTTPFRLIRMIEPKIS